MNPLRFALMVAMATTLEHAAAMDAPTHAPQLQLTLAPTHAADGHADGVAVSYTYTPVAAGTTPLTLQLDTLEPGLERNTDQVTDLTVADDNGPLPLGDSSRSEKGPRTFITWTATRPATGTLHVAYRMPVARGKATKRGPQFDLQAAGGGVSGGFVSFLVLPDSADGRIDAHVHWQLTPGDTAVSSYGEGDYAGTFTPNQLNDTLFLAGPVTVYRKPGQSKDDGLAIYGLGVAREKLEGAGGWAAAAYAAEVKAFKLEGHRPYRFMVRSFTGGTMASGRAAEHSFMLYVPPGGDPGTDQLHYVVAHEMVHSLARYLEKEDVDGDWYTEGLANYLGITIPGAAGLYTPERYAALVSAESAAYYTNARRGLVNSEMAKAAWIGRNAWLLPYNRGAMYFADLDAKLKARGSDVTVLDLANEMSARIDGGAPSDRTTWLEVLRKHTGPWAIDDWNAMMAGKTIFPAAGAFGSCMHAQKADVRIFDLGFATPVRLSAGATIGGVVPGGRAAQAGLRDGDVLESGVDINPVVGSIDEPIALHVRRDGKPLTIRYDPSGGMWPGLTWTSSCLAAARH
jgi:hypothetical protein